MSFKDNLKNELSYQDIQLKQLSERIGVSYATLLCYVNHRECLPKIDVGYKIAQELDVTMEYLITGNPEDIYQKNTLPLYKELIKLPTPIIKSFEKIIHSYYELYYKKN